MAPSVSSRDRPWHSHLTLDLVIYAAQKTILHPFIAWMLPLSLRAITIPYSHISFQLTTAYASFLTLLWILSIFNQRLAFGNPREVDVSEEIIVVTGGASGLGQSITDFYRMRGASVAVLDVKSMPEEELGGIQYYKCDIGNPQELRQAANQIRQDLGTPTILINNAGVMIGKSILNLSDAELQKTMNSNVLSHFYAVREFLPDMLEEDRGTIVTIGSVLGYLGCANLADYAASKAALVAFHASLRAELRMSDHPNASSVKTVFVAPGQLGTQMFAGVKTPSNFLAPVVESVELAKDIVQMIDDGESGEIRLPFYARWAPTLGSLPVSIQLLARRLSGIDHAMLEYSKLKKA